MKKKDIETIVAVGLVVLKTVEAILGILGRKKSS